MLCAVLASACATVPRDPSAAPPAAEASTGGCRPWFVSPGEWDAPRAPDHSCWNLLWEVPTAAVVVPLALGLFTAPVWVPIVLLR